MTPAPSDSPSGIDRRRPWGRLGRKRRFALTLDAIRPVVRIAHRRRGPLRIDERIILDHEFVLIERGEGRFRCGVGDEPFSAGDLLFVRPFEPHGFEPVEREDPGATHLAVHFDFSPTAPGVDAAVLERRPYRVDLPAGRALPTRCSLPRGHVVGSLLGDLVRRWEQGDDAARLTASGLLMQALAELMRESSEAAAQGAAPEPDPAVDAANRLRLERVVAFVDAHYAEPLSAESLAEVAGLSESHFARLFRRWMGESVMRYVRRRRIDAARRLLTDVDLSIKQVAGLTGFGDPFHFSRVFRQVDGLSPRQYREQALAGGGQRDRERRP